MKRFSPAFLVACLLMFCFALSFNLIVRAMEWTLHKEAVPLRKSLIQMDTRFGPYTMRQKEQRLPRDVEVALGSKDYITWYYQLHDENGAPTNQGVRLHIVYYTGSVDQIPHIPDRCYIAGGLAPGKDSTQRKIIELKSPPIVSRDGQWYAPDGKEDLYPITSNEFSARQFHFTMPTFNDLHTSVVYFFIANDEFVAERGRIKTMMFDLSRSSAYFAKVEVMAGKWSQVPGHRKAIFIPEEDPDVALRNVTHFLSYAIGPISACLPGEGEAITSKSNKVEEDAS